MPNDRVKDSEKLLATASKENYASVISFGQKPNIKNKIHIETTAKCKSTRIDTYFNCEKLKALFEHKGITAKISHNAGTSYCNSLYYNGLANLQKENIKAKMVFIHIPFIKNIDNPDSFFKTIIEVITKIDDYEA